MGVFISRFIGALIVIAAFWVMAFVGGMAVGGIASIFMAIPLIKYALIFASYTAGAVALTLIIGEATGSIEWND